MGLGDLPESNDDDNSGNSPSSSSNKSKEEKEKAIEIGSGPNKKTFSEEKWAGVKKVIHQETEYTPDEVKNLPADKRFEVLHECALVHEGKKKRRNMSHQTSERCIVCGSDVTNFGVEIEDESVCPRHPVGKVVKQLRDD